jgi:hypothetical protein
MGVPGAAIHEAYSFYHLRLGNEKKVGSIFKSVILSLSKDQPPVNLQNLPEWWRSPGADPSTLLRSAQDDGER